jgi:glutathione S-transferase
MLQSSGVTHLYVVGVMTNTCVAATSVHARRLGYDITLISDLVFALKPETSEKAINRLTASPYDISLSTSEQIPSHIDGKAGASLPKLYYVNGSIPSWRVMLCLSLKRIPYAAIRLRVMTNPKETRSVEFAAINPRCKTPTFVDVDGTVVIESLAILQYLEQYYSEKENLRLMPEARNKTQSGDEFGMADCAFYPILAYMIHRGLELVKRGFPGLQEYAQRCAYLRAAKEARPEGWEEPGKSLFVKCEKLVEEKS